LYQHGSPVILEEFGVSSDFICMAHPRARPSPSPRSGSVSSASTAGQKSMISSTVPTECPCPGVARRRSARLTQSALLRGHDRRLGSHRWPSVGESGPLSENVAEIPSEPKDLVDICAKLICCASTGAHIRSEEWEESHPPRRRLTPPSPTGKPRTEGPGSADAPPGAAACPLTDRFSIQHR
jgi:hypothetical protein